ncbi:MAG: hypothetical protein AB7F40_09595 [Victivallaceae bacterium]
MRRFTLIEVVVALTILTAGVLVASQMFAMSASRMSTAETEWFEQHLLTQAAEYFLVAPPRDSLPERFLEDSTYSVSAKYSPADQLSDTSTEQGELALMKMTVTLYRNGVAVGELDIHRIMRRSDL